VPAGLLASSGCPSARLELDTQAVHRTIAPGKETCDLVDVEDGAVIEAGVAEPGNVGFDHGGGRPSELVHVLEHRLVGRFQRDAGVVLLEGLDPLFVAYFCEETLPVVLHSVVAGVDLRNGYRDHLAAAKTDPTVAMHDSLVERHQRA